MASLKKPQCCNKCGSRSLFKIISKWTIPNYEGWYCLACIPDLDKVTFPDAFIVSRVKRMKESCRKCGVKKSDGVEFVKGKNLCKKCASGIHAQYREENKDELKKKRDVYYAGLDQGVRWQRVRKVIQGSADAFMRDQMYHIKSHSQNPSYRDVKDEVRRQFDLDGPYLMELWEKQKGKCAITNLDMSYKFGDLRAVSIDRIDSSKGHVKGNIQLVCQCVNLMKNDHSNDDLFDFFTAYFEYRRDFELSEIAAGTPFGKMIEEGYKIDLDEKRAAIKFEILTKEALLKTYRDERDESIRAKINRDAYGEMVREEDKRLFSEVFLDSAKERRSLEALSRLAEIVKPQVKEEI